MFLHSRYDFILQQGKRTCVVDKIPAGCLSLVRKDGAFLFSIFTWKNTRAETSPASKEVRDPTPHHSLFPFQMGPRSLASHLKAPHTCLWAPLSSEKSNPVAQD